MNIEILMHNIYIYINIHTYIHNNDNDNGSKLLSWKLGIKNKLSGSVF